MYYLTSVFRCASGAALQFAARESSKWVALSCPDWQGNMSSRAGSGIRIPQIDALFSAVFILGYFGLITLESLHAFRVTLAEESSR